MAKRKSNNTRKKNKNGKKIENIQGNDITIRKALYSVIGILCFFLVFFLLTVYITNKNNKDEKKDENKEEGVSISYDEILLGRSLSMGNEEYLVIFYDGSDDTNKEDFDSLVDNYRYKPEHLNLYYVDMSKSFNKPFATTEEANRSPQDTASMKINGPTIIRVIDQKVTEYIEGKDAITTMLS